MNYKSEFEDFMKLLSTESGKIINSYFRTGVTVDAKSDDSPVTIADKKSEEKMRALIEKHFPEHGILGEEFGSHNENAEWVWVLDPIDGTKSFICGTVTFGTLIAITRNGQPVLGVINQPVLGEFLIGDNNIAELNGKKVQMRQNFPLEKSVLLTTDHKNISKYRDAAKFDRLIDATGLYRNWGDCYGYYLLATGYADIMVDPIMHLWDTMAVVPVVRGAGGIITDFGGGDPIAGDSIVAAAPALHSRVVSILN